MLDVLATLNAAGATNVVATRDQATGLWPATRLHREPAAVSDQLNMLDKVTQRHNCHSCAPLAVSLQIVITVHIGGYLRASSRPTPVTVRH